MAATTTGCNVVRPQRRPACPAKIRVGFFSARSIIPDQVSSRPQKTLTPNPSRSEDNRNSLSNRHLIILSFRKKEKKNRHLIFDQNFIQEHLFQKLCKRKGNAAMAAVTGCDAVRPQRRPACPAKIRVGFFSARSISPNQVSSQPQNFNPQIHQDPKITKVYYPIAT
ncbi:protein serine threonine phosphatases [Striga asiatica]|uniref:Protein serine threonine phosphatases n=1 Tax=Striga asiatica TaxID=4170 RepID=A0A5A7Q1M7_STRAF|nr:protein serine threonine phosphatases [Striga asiatica]